MVFAIEHFLQSSNGTGRKEKGHQQILASLKKEYSLFGDILLLPLLPTIKVEWGDRSLSLISPLPHEKPISLKNLSSSLFLRMQVDVEENGVPAMPKLEPLSFHSPTNAFNFTSHGLNGLQKREMRSTDRKILVRWFWIDSCIHETKEKQYCEVIVQFTVPKDETQKKRKRPEESAEDAEMEATSYLARMTRILENMQAAQQAHYDKMERFFSINAQPAPLSRPPDIGGGIPNHQGMQVRNASGMSYIKNPSELYMPLQWSPESFFPPTGGS